MKAGTPFRFLQDLYPGCYLQILDKSTFPQKINARGYTLEGNTTYIVKFEEERDMLGFRKEKKLETLQNEQFQKAKSKLQAKNSLLTPETVHFEYGNTTFILRDHRENFVHIMKNYINHKANIEDLAALINFNSKVDKSIFLRVVEASCVLPPSGSDYDVQLIGSSIVAQSEEAKNMRGVTPNHICYFEPMETA